MSFHHIGYSGFKPHAATAKTSLTAAKEPPARSGEESGQLCERAAQAICDATNDLMDCAMRTATLDEAIALARVVRSLRRRIDAIATRACERMDELCNEGE